MAAPGWGSVPDDVLRRVSRDFTGSVVCAGLPDSATAQGGMELGVDLKSWTLGPRFRGVKLLPPGLRFLHYRLVAGAKSGEIGTGMPRGIFLDIGHGSCVEVASLSDSVLARDVDWCREDRLRREEEVIRGVSGQICGLRWDAQAEDFAPIVSEEQHDEQVAQLAELRTEVRGNHMDSGLGAYDLDDFELWGKLSHKLDRRVLSRCGLAVGQVVASSRSSCPSSKSHGSVQYCEPHFPTLPNLTRLAREFRTNSSSSKSVTTLLSDSFFYGSNGSKLSATEITALQLDPSPLLLRLLELEFASTGFEEFLGQTQLAFILFIYLASMQGLEFWKESVQLVCSSASFKSTRSEDAADFAEVLNAQMQLMPIDLFTHELLEDNFLFEAFGTFFSKADEMPQRLRNSLGALRKSMEARFGAPLVQRIINHIAQQEDELLRNAITCANEDTLTRANEQSLAEERVEFTSGALVTITEEGHAIQLPMTADDTDVGCELEGQPSEQHSQFSSPPRQRMDWMLQ